MKQNRSSIYTEGITISIKNNPDQRFFLFELDKPHRCYEWLIHHTYHKYYLDYLVHPTGSGGIHFLSPTVIDKDIWKKMHDELESINADCPMLTLRIMPNKYHNEKEIWYKSEIQYYIGNIPFNSYQMCFYLNKIFGSVFEGTFNADIITVKYPLPISEFCK